ncbi:hypothetical protein [Embleya sp. MST-111070]|uniref:hypothetical protein n=1 Tax=Embleya sp. MST-111070 TaxID=3398231 RepID=UPI003F731541
MAAFAQQKSSDALYAWTCARDGLTSETADPDATDATQRLQALRVLLYCDSRADRMKDAARRCRRVARVVEVDWPDCAREYEYAAHLCEVAERLARHAGSLRDNPIDTRDRGSASSPTRPQSADRTTKFPMTTLLVVPRYEPATGTLRVVAPHHGDGIPWVVHPPGAGLHGGLICGPDAAAVADVFRQIVAAVLHESQIVVWMSNGRRSFERGHSPDHSVALRSETVDILRAAAHITAVRTLSEMTGRPTPERRGILVAVEDAHIAFAGDPGAVAAAELIAVQGPEVNVALVVTTPGHQLRHFGDNRLLRTALARLNTLYLAESITAALAPVHGRDDERKPLPRPYWESAQSRR